MDCPTCGPTLHFPPLDERVARDENEQEEATDCQGNYSNAAAAVAAAVATAVAAAVAFCKSSQRLLQSF